ncbi:hypothetical protein OROGR_027875 [Orobanche gracilis]
MATRNEAVPPQGRAVVEEEQAEKELDTDDFSRLCSQHCGGIPTSYGADERKSTMVCTTPADLDDGPEDASSVGVPEYQPAGRSLQVYLSNLLEMEAVLRRRWGDSGDGRQRGKKMDPSCTISDSLSLRSAFRSIFESFPICFFFADEHVHAAAAAKGLHI